MKKNCGIVIFTSVLLMTNLFAQEAKIELPEVVTEVFGYNVSAEKDSLPNFEVVVDLPPSSEDIVPILPEEDIPENKYQPSLLQEPIKMHGDGLIGGGYPGILLGEFNLFQIDEKNPLALNFTHDSAYGYANHSLLSGYSDRNTKINLEKTFTFDTLKLDLQGAFETIGTGLQSQQENFSSINQNKLYGFTQIAWNPLPTFLIGTNVNLSYYNRYLDSTKNAEAISSIPRWETELNIFDLEPNFFVKWSDFGFTAGLNGQYLLNVDTSDIFDDSKTLNRGFVQAVFGWKNDIFGVNGDVGIVFGNQLAENQVIVPFTVSFSLNLPSYFSSRNTTIALYGGLNSQPTSILNKEIDCKFSAFSKIPQEQSDWFGAFELVLPIKSSFTGKAFVEYKHTAFENGVWDVDYSNMLGSGLYGYSKLTRQSLATEFSVAYKYKIFSLTGKWKSNWFYVPSFEAGQHVSLEISFQDDNLLWGTSLSAGIPIVAALEYVPTIDFEAFVTISKSVRIMLNANDMVKLFTGQTRLYAGNYVERSGSATLSIKYIF